MSQSTHAVFRRFGLFLLSTVLVSFGTSRMLNGQQSLKLTIQWDKLTMAGMSQLVGYPTQYPSVSMMDWMTNRPNARFWELKHIKDSFHPGDKLVETLLNSSDVDAQAFVTPAGRKFLLVNKQNCGFEVALTDADKASALTVDSETGDSPARSMQINACSIKLEPFEVTIVNW